jgi:hypothetical protein
MVEAFVLNVGLSASHQVKEETVVHLLNAKRRSL